MSYLEEFKIRINSREFSKFFQLWEEYCTNDIVDVEELLELLQMVKNSDMSKFFGKVIETILPLLDMIEDQKSRYEVLKLAIDLQTTNTPALADITLQYLKNRGEPEAVFNERIRLTGLRGRENFQGAIRNHELLAHLQVGNFVYHPGGLGTGEVLEISPLLEQVSIEFENVSGKKSINFVNAFKTLIPLEKENFLVRRFADGDELEKEAKENPVEVIKLLLRDIGPKNASELKDELAGLVIPEKEWTKWWQSTRTKLKKDPLIETPENLKSPFRLRKMEQSQEERLEKAIFNKKTAEEIILTTYNFMRDLPSAKKQEKIITVLEEKLTEQLALPDLTIAEKLQILILLETMFNKESQPQNKQNNSTKKSAELISSLKSEEVEPLINKIQIVALKKRALVLIRENREDYAKHFIHLLFILEQAGLRDYLLQELNQGETKIELDQKIQHLKEHPANHPEFFVWFFQKILSKESQIIPTDKKLQDEFVAQFFESFLILMSAIENKPEYRDLTKKMYGILLNKRYETVRKIIEGKDLEFIKEFLLLASKCQTLTDHDLKILRSLSEVVHPSLSVKNHDKGLKQVDGHIIWTTEAGLIKIQERIKQIATKEMLENAKEVEAARALGDLRENSEYKFACEKRARLQGEMKTLSEQLNRARVITSEDIYPDEISVGSVVELKDSKDQVSCYTVLGPFDVDVDQNILSFQSKFAQAMIGYKTKESFQFKDEEYRVENIKSYLDK